MIIKWCRRCLYPSLKPDIRFDETGLCSACSNFDNRPQIDWKVKEREFVDLIRFNGGDSGYSCIVPVSGGKDSTAQVVKCLELGFRPLAVNARTDLLSDLGRRNLDNIASLCDLVEVHPRDDIRRRIMRLALEEVGDWSWPEHVLIHTVPFREAVQRGIPTIVFGELSPAEYGAGPKGSEQLQLMTRGWVEEFAGLLGMRVTDVAEILDLGLNDLAMYQFPTQEELTFAGTKAVWLGQYFPWDGYENSQIARKHKFELFGDDHVEGSVFNYENLDNHATGPRDYLRYLKYGYGRATDICSSHIRRGRMTREEGLQIVRERDGMLPMSYLGRPLHKILNDVGITINAFTAVCRRFANKELFDTSAGGWPNPKFNVI